MKFKQLVLFSVLSSFGVLCLEGHAQEPARNADAQTLIQLLEFIGEFGTDDASWLEEESIQDETGSSGQATRGAEQNAGLLGQQDAGGSTIRLEDDE